ncbi:hypothetical protein DFH06DRAFT_155702 [Mycena polygramma]|nr:hypothetical protein DFH06DRAFT_155702 [Mycena polygramma]
MFSASWGMLRLPRSALSAQPLLALRRLPCWQPCPIATAVCLACQQYGRDRGLRWVRGSMTAVRWSLPLRPASSDPAAVPCLLSLNDHVARHIPARRSARRSAPTAAQSCLSSLFLSIVRATALVTSTIVLR